MDIVSKNIIDKIEKETIIEDIISGKSSIDSITEIDIIDIYNLLFSRINKRDDKLLNILQNYVNKFMNKLQTQNGFYGIDINIRLFESPDNIQTPKQLLIKKSKSYKSYIDSYVSFLSYISMNTFSYSKLIPYVIITSIKFKEYELSTYGDLDIFIKSISWINSDDIFMLMKEKSIFTEKERKKSLPKNNNIIDGLHKFNISDVSRIMSKNYSTKCDALCILALSYNKIIKNNFFGYTSLILSIINSQSITCKYINDDNIPETVYDLIKLYAMNVGSSEYNICGKCYSKQSILVYNTKNYNNGNFNEYVKLFLNSCYTLTKKYKLYINTPLNIMYKSIIKYYNDEKINDNCLNIFEYIDSIFSSGGMILFPYKELYIRKVYHTPYLFNDDKSYNYINVLKIDENNNTYVKCNNIDLSSSLINLYIMTDKHIDNSICYSGKTLESKTFNKNKYKVPDYPYMIIK